MRVIFKKLGAAAVLAAMFSASFAPASAQAEGQLRIAQQFGVVYLLLNLSLIHI